MCNIGSESTSHTLKHITICQQRECCNMRHCAYDVNSSDVFYVQDMKLINDTLTTRTFVEILNSDDPKVIDDYGSVNLELEVCLLVQLVVL